MRKRIIYVVLTAVMLGNLFTGCKKNKDDNNNEIIQSTTKSNDLKDSYTNDKNKDITNDTSTKESYVQTSLSVPDVIGKSRDNAVAILEKAGFKVKEKEENSDTVDKGYVINQSPSADNGLKLSTGDEVTITVSAGKKLQTAKYLDTIVYSSYTAQSVNSKMSAYSGKDMYGNVCNRAIKFECDADSKNYSDDNTTKTVKVIYALDKSTSKFSCTLSPLDINEYNVIKYIHVNIYKDDTVLFSMDISRASQPLDLSYDLTGAQTFTIELTHEVTPNYSAKNASIVMSDAKFE